MRLVMVLEYFYNSGRPIGGAEKQVAKLARQFIDRGVTVTVVTGQWRPGESMRAVVEGIPVYRLFTGWGMFNLKGLRKFGHYAYLINLFIYLVSRKNRYDFIHCHSAMSSAFVVALAGKLLRKKTLARPMASGNRWGDLSRMKNEQSLLGSRWMLSRYRDIDCMIALNQDVAGELQAIGVPAEKIAPMPNGVEVEGIPHKTSYRIPAEAKITFVGRLDSQKGLEILLAALKLVAVNCPTLNWRLQLVGQGQLRPELEAQARQLGIESGVQFAGQVGNVFPILADSDIFVLPSRAEGMSNALLEAMTCGLPCIASNIAANAQLISHGKNGWLVQTDDETDLAQAIIELAQNQNLREQLGRAARNTIREHYAIDRIAERYLALYHNLLQGRPIQNVMAGR